jgi:hypothetical protein
LPPQKPAQFLIATDLSALLTTARDAIHKQSTNLPTGFCGYRGNRYSLALLDYATRQIAALH